jgi:hypothetical protein
MKKIEVSVFRRGAHPRRTGTKKIRTDQAPQDATVLYMISGGQRKRRRPDPAAIKIRPPVFEVKKTS